MAARARTGAYALVFKRALDIGLCLAVLPLALPLVAVLAVLARRDGGPAFYPHVRVGMGGARFRCWKLRSMVPDAHARLAAILASDPAARAEWQRTHKLQNDPRVTALGRLLRRTGLDELPQLWCVLRGEMSLVGPRPVTVPELERYGRHRRVYLALRPGLTGLWQVAGRGAVDYEARVALDVRYCEALSLFTDIGILMRTAGTVLRRTGA